MQIFLIIMLTMPLVAESGKFLARDSVMKTEKHVSQKDSTLSVVADDSGVAAAAAPSLR